MKLPVVPVAAHNGDSSAALVGAACGRSVACSLCQLQLDCKPMTSEGMQSESPVYLVQISILYSHRDAWDFWIWHMAVALPVVILHKDQGALGGQVPAGQVLAAQKLQIPLSEAIKHHLRPPEFNHLQTTGNTSPELDLQPGIFQKCPP